MNTYEQARQKYLPEVVRVLFVAEAPPENVERFFYYEEVKDHDALFVNLIRALYVDYHDADVAEIRSNKRELLKRFQEDGYYLIDALSEPISLKLKPRERKKLIENRANEIAAKIKMLNPKMGTVLIKVTVYESLIGVLQERGLPILNTIGIPFPSYGHIRKFKTSIQKILDKS